jgi:hypothetical protein
MHLTGHSPPKRNVRDVRSALNWRHDREFVATEHGPDEGGTAPGPSYASGPMPCCSEPAPREGSIGVRLAAPRWWLAIEEHAVEQFRLRCLKVDEPPPVPERRFPPPWTELCEATRTEGLGQGSL